MRKQLGVEEGNMIDAIFAYDQRKKKGIATLDDEIERDEAYNSLVDRGFIIAIEAAEFQPSKVAEWLSSIAILALSSYFLLLILNGVIVNLTTTHP